MAAETVALPGILPAIPATTRERALALLAVTRRIVDLQAELRVLRAESDRLVASLSE